MHLLFFSSFLRLSIPLIHSSETRPLSSVMGSYNHLPKSKTKRTIHQILGGGPVADVILWRRKNVSKCILMMGFGAWLMFHRFGYSLLPFVSNVLLLLTSVLFLWSKSARILNRPVPRLPRVYLSEEVVNKMAEGIRVRLNTLFSVSRDIALAKDSSLFFRTAAVMLLISVIGSLTDLITLVYISFIVSFTVPALYERYEDHIDGFLFDCSRMFHELYVRLYDNVQRFITEMQNLS